MQAPSSELGKPETSAAVPTWFARFTDQDTRPARETNSLNLDPDHLRNMMRTRRRQLDPAAATDAAVAVAERVTSLLSDARPRAVGLYQAVRGELPTDPLAKALRAQGIDLAYPRVEAGGALTFVLNPKSFTRGAFGIEEPDGEPCQHNALGGLVCPGLAFDRQGGRVGYGKGYYDRYLGAGFQGAKIGIGFAFQVVSHLELAPWDQPMHWVVTPDEAISGAR